MGAFTALQSSTTSLINAATLLSLEALMSVSFVPLKESPFATIFFASVKEAGIAVSYAPHAFKTSLAWPSSDLPNEGAFKI